MNKFHYAVGFLLVASVADLITTVLGIGVFGLAEQNPVAIGLLRSSGFAGLVGLTVVALSVIIGITSILDKSALPASSSVAYGALLIGGSVKFGAAIWNSFLMLS